MYVAIALFVQKTHGFTLETQINIPPFNMVVKRGREKGERVCTAKVDAGGLRAANAPTYQMPG